MRLKLTARFRCDLLNERLGSEAEAGQAASEHTATHRHHYYHRHRQCMACDSETHSWASVYGGNQKVIFVWPNITVLTVKSAGAGGESLAHSSTHQHMRARDSAWHGDSGRERPEAACSTQYIPCIHSHSIDKGIEGK